MSPSIPETSLTARVLEAVPLFSGIRPSLENVPSVGVVLEVMKLLEARYELSLMRLSETDLTSYLRRYTTSGAQACLTASQTCCPYST